jgi:hypothetical protein
MGSLVGEVLLRFERHTENPTLHTKTSFEICVESRQKALLEKSFSTSFMTSEEHEHVHRLQLGSSEGSNFPLSCLAATAKLQI